MHLGDGVTETDCARYTPRAQLFAALKQRKLSGEENFYSLLNESRIHQSPASVYANRSLEETNGKSPQSFFQLSLPVLPPNGSPEGTKQLNCSVQSQLLLLSDDCKEMSMNVQQMPKSWLFDQLKRAPSALPPVRLADKLSDSQAAKSESSDSSGIQADSSIRSTLKQTESTKPLSDAVVLELFKSPNSEHTECIKYTPEKLTVGHKRSGLKQKTYVKSRIFHSKDSFVSHDNDSADDSREKNRFHSGSSFKSGNSEKVLDKSKDFLVWSTSVLANSSEEEDALNEIDNSQEAPVISSAISLPNLFPSTELLSPQTLDSESHSATDHSFSRKNLITVSHVARLSVGKEVSSSREDVQIQSSGDEVCEPKPTSMERIASTEQSGGMNDDQKLSKLVRPSKRLSLHLRKHEIHSLSSKGDAVVITENLLSSTDSELERGHRNVVELDKWTLQLISNQRLSVAGYRKDERGGRLHCSDPVTLRLRRDMVQTTSGMLYCLSGNLCKSTATESGLSSKFLDSFLDGFPPNWKDLLNFALRKISLRVSGSYSPVQKVLQEAKPLSDSVEDKRSCKPAKKVNTSVIEPLQCKGSKNDPLTLQDLPVTRRSGRRVIPPLAFWANQRVLVSPTTKAVSIAQENENALDLPALHFKSRNEISSEEESGCEILTGSKRRPGRPRRSTDVVMQEMEIENTDVIKTSQGIRSLQTPTRRKNQSGETSSKRRPGRPRKGTDVVMQEMEIENTDVMKNSQGIRSVGGQSKDGNTPIDSVIGLQMPTRRKNKSCETSYKRRPGRPRKGTDVVMQEMEIENTDVIKNSQGIRSAGGQPKDGNASMDSVIASGLQTPTRRKNQSGEISVQGFQDNRGSYRKQEKLIKGSRSCSTSSANTVCYSAQKRQRLNLKNYKDHHQPSGVSTIDDCPHSPQVPQQTLQSGSGNNLTIIRKLSLKSDSTEESTGLSRSRRSDDVESDRNAVKIPVQYGTCLNKTMTLMQDPKIIRNCEKQKRQNSTHGRHEVLMNRKENESEGRKKLWSGSVISPSHKAVLRNENTGEKGRQKKPQQRSSSKVRSPRRKYTDVCSKLSSVQPRRSEERRSDAEESSRKRTNRQSIKDLGSRESLEFVYKKSDYSEGVVVMRHDSKTRREHVMKAEASFLTKSPELMQGLPPKPRPSLLFLTSGDLSDDSNDSSKVEYFFSSDESET